MESYSKEISNALRKVRRETAQAIGGIITIFAIVALVCSNVTYTQFDTPYLYTDYTISADSNKQEIIIYATITEEMLGKVLSFYTNDSYVDAYLKNKQIYHFGEHSNLCKSPGSMYQIVSIPDDYRNIGETVEIHINTVYRNKYTDTYDIYISTSGGLIVSKLKHEILDIIANIVLMMLGIIMCIVYILERANRVNTLSMLYLGLASILVSIWTNCTLFAFQLMLPSGIGQYYLYFCSFMILPMLLIMYFESMHESEVSYLVELYIHTTATIIMLMLQISGIWEFTESIAIYLVVCMGELVSIIVKSLTSVYHMKYKALSVGFVILVACIIINIITYISDTTEHASLYLTKLGFIIYIVISLYMSFEHLMITVINSSESDRLDKIAYTDVLTKLGNRYAFDRDIKTISLKYLHLVSIDLNNLKYFNDTYGHAYGDELIVEASHIIRNCMRGSIYRTNGDEFIVIQAGTTEKEVIDEIEHIYEQSEKFNLTTDTGLVIEIACGYSGYTDGDKSYEDILKRADKRMYKDKQRLKSESRIKYEKEM